MTKIIYSEDLYDNAIINSSYLYINEKNHRV
jgi:hypothetical protein